MHQQDALERAKQIIADNRYMTVATASLDGKPWISPVSFAHDEKYNFFWVSSKNALHSALIRINSRIAVTIFDSTVQDEEIDAVYFEAEATELQHKKDLEHAIKTLSYLAKSEDLRVKEPGQVLGENVWRIYKAVPKIVHKLVKGGDHINGQYVDRHVQISLATDGKR